MTDKHNFRLGGYATGNYFCRCNICDDEFEGDKRARICLPCAAADASTVLDRLKKFPTMIRQMWSGEMVQEWINRQFYPSPQHNQTIKGESNVYFEETTYRATRGDHPSEGR